MHDARYTRDLPTATEIAHEIDTWTAAYQFTYPDDYDALVIAYGQPRADRMAAERRYAEYYGCLPDWPPLPENEQP